ncbi:hypothetical protein COB72_03060 [bacterium]|nr:MAG: hypothetical protein COB72_03060 [bacterium]
MAIVGAFARVDTEYTSACREELDQLGGVSTFDLDDPDKVGILIEADTLDDAHSTITKTIRSTTGVMGVWPVYVNTEDEQEQLD